MISLSRKPEDHMTRPVVHFEIRGRDAGRLITFYRELFGWSIDADNPMGYGFVQAGVGGPEAGVGGGITAGTEPRVVIFVQVADLQDSLARAATLGGSRVMEPFDVPGGPTIAQIADPEGNVVGLVQQ
jgi:predicted enzyme related to lactoylglutathione lyase